MSINTKTDVLRMVIKMNFIQFEMDVLVLEVKASSKIVFGSGRRWQVLSTQQDLNSSSRPK